MQGCCSKECTSIINLSDDEQKAIRKGLKNGNKIFKKGKSDVLTYRNSGDNNAVTTTYLSNEKNIKIKKIFVGQATHFFVKASVGQFDILENEIKIGDKILIKGTTTGNQEIILSEMFIENKIVQKAIIGDVLTIKLPFRIRLSDKLYKIID